MPTQPAPSTQRAIDLVRFLADHPEESFAVADLARRLGQSRATCQAVLLALEAADWVRRGEAGGYELGPGLIAIGAAAQRGVGILDVLRSDVHRLHIATGKEVMGCLPSGEQLLVVARSGPTTPFSAAVMVGQPYPLVPPLGLAYTAWDEEEFARWSARAPQLSRRGQDMLRKAAAEVRSLGYNITLDPVTRRILETSVDKLAPEHRTEVTRVLVHDRRVSAAASRSMMRVSHLSAPVFGPSGQIVALMGVVFGPDESGQISELAVALCRATERTSATTGAGTRTPGLRA